MNLHRVGCKCCACLTGLEITLAGIDATACYPACTDVAFLGGQSTVDDLSAVDGTWAIEPTANSPLVTGHAQVPPGNVYCDYRGISTSVIHRNFWYTGTGCAGTQTINEVLATSIIVIYDTTAEKLREVQVVGSATIFSWAGAADLGDTLNNSLTGPCFVDERYTGGTAVVDFAP